jgi:hypothetical protein
MILEKIIDSFFVGDNLKISKRNFNVIENEVNNFGTQINSFAPHLSDLVTDADGAHGLKIEKGSFTPKIAGATVAGSNTYATQSGHYIKIGDMVYLSIYIVLTALDAALSGTIIINGLPFSVANLPSNYINANVLFSNVDIGTGYTAMSGYIESTQARIILQKLGNNVAMTSLNQANLKANSIFMINLAYRIA